LISGTLIKTLRIKVIEKIDWERERGSYLILPKYYYEKYFKLMKRIAA
jgi:hypothetical protein